MKHSEQYQQRRKPLQNRLQPQMKQKFTNLAAAINYLFSTGATTSHSDIELIGLEIELRGEIYL